MPSPEESHIKQHSEPNDTSVLFHKQLQQKVLPFAKPFTCKKDEPLLLRGDDAHSFYYIIKGSVEVSYTTQETKITVAIIGAGSFFGEIGFFDKGSRTRDIQATEETEILIFNQKVMNQL